jgi:hypothetical protein
MTPTGRALHRVLVVTTPVVSPTETTRPATTGRTTSTRPIASVASSVAGLGLCGPCAGTRPPSGNPTEQVFNISQRIAMFGKTTQPSRVVPTGCGSSCCLVSETHSGAHNPFHEDPLQGKRVSHTSQRIHPEGLAEPGGAVARLTCETSSFVASPAEATARPITRSCTAKRTK